MRRKRFEGWIAGSAAGLILSGAGQALAQAAGAAGEEVLSHQMTWAEIVQACGWFLWPLGALSLLAVAFVVYFFIVLRASAVIPRPLLRELLEKVRARATDEARRACEYRPCPLAAVGLAALDHVSQVPDADPALLKDVIEGEGGRQSVLIQGQTQYLLDVAVIAPMVGLLGTVWGMLKAFSAVAVNIASAKPAVLAAGVTQAIVTTVFGLFIAIPAMLFYAYFRRKAARLVLNLENASVELFTALVSTGTESPESRKQRGR